MGSVLIQGSLHQSLSGFIVLLHVDKVHPSEFRDTFSAEEVR